MKSDYCDKYPKSFWQRTLQFFGINSTRFKRIRNIGQGSFGSVYIVQDKVTNKKYVMKVYHYSKTIFKSGKSNAQIQYYNLSNLGKNCSKYFTCPLCLYQEGFNTVLLMDYLEGYENLFDYLDIHAPTFSQKQTIAKKLVQAINYLHKKGIAHRDIKPDNIMINPTTQDVRIIDFGLACDENTCHYRAGNHFWMAPEIEQAGSKQKITLQQFIQADLYSLGLVIAFLFSNKLDLIVLPQKYKMTLDQVNKEFIQKPLNKNIILLSQNPNKRTLDS